MKNILLFILALCISSCSNDKNNDTEIESPSINLKTQITYPIKNRDFSFYDNGKYGVFEDPTAEKKLTAKITLEEGNTISNNDLTVRWKSDLDGTLYEGKPDKNLESEIDVNLSKGLHKILFEVYSSDNKIIEKDSILISNIIKLQAEAETGRSIKLNWTKYEGDDFVSYLIYGEYSKNIAEINDINTLTYDCPETKSLINEQRYQIIVKTSKLDKSILGSNLLSKLSGNFIEFSYYIPKIIKDSQRSKIYAIVAPQYQSDTADKYGLLIINSETFKIESHILTNERFSDLDISPNGQYLYLTQLRAEKLTKIDLNTMSLLNFQTSTNNWGFRKIEAGNNDVLFCQTTNPPRMIVLNGINGEQINTNYSEFKLGDMEFDSKIGKFYFGDSNTSAGVINCITYINQIIKVEKNYPVFPEAILYPEPFLIISDDNESILWEKFQLETDLKVKRTFETKMIACSPSNTYLSDIDRVYDYNNLSVIFNYPPFPSNELTKSILFIDDNTVVTCKTSQPHIVGEPAKSYFFKIKIR